MTYAAEKCIPMTFDGSDIRYSVPGWSDFVSEKHDLAREAFLDWIALGKPFDGGAVYRMRRIRAAFKLALRYCKQHEEETRADACAKSLQSRETKTFWHNVNKICSNKHVNTFGDAVDNCEVAEMWKNHFQQLYSSIDSTSDKYVFYDRLNMREWRGATVLSVCEITCAVNQQKRANLRAQMVWIWRH